MRLLNTNNFNFHNQSCTLLHFHQVIFMDSIRMEIHYLIKSNCINLYEIGHTKNAINVIKNESYVEKTAYEMKYQLCYK